MAPGGSGQNLKLYLIGGVAVAVIVIVAVLLLLYRPQPGIATPAATSYPTTIPTTTAAVFTVPTTTAPSPATTTALPGSGGVYSILANIANNQQIPTPANFQQMITLDPSQYASYANADLGNIRFFYRNTELYSWCESGCSNTSSSAVFWVKLPVPISAGSQIQLLILFEPMKTNYDGVYAGEAPQLSPIYAQYDNGANIFNIYTNFAGTSLSSNWINTDQSDGNAAVAKIDNGLYYYSTPGNGGSLSYSTQINPQEYVFETYTEFTSQVGGTSGGWPEVLLGTTGTVSYSRVPSIEIAMGGCSTPNNIEFVSIGGPNIGNGGFGSLPASLNTYYVTSLYETPTAGYGAINYNPLGNTGGTTGCSYLGGPYFTPQNMTSMSYWAFDGAGLKSQWMRVRLIPPDGVMPSVSFTST